jgi:prepilin-type N-terminal cleavage/methylation domain-containing protein
MIRDHERGFTLLETLAAVSLTGIAVLGVAGAVAASLYGSARSETKLLLADDASNVLTDLRAASAYDPVMLAALDGRHATARLALPGPRGPRIVVMTAAVARRAVGGSGDSAPRIGDEYVASVTATAADGTTVTERVTLVAEAPAPGSRVP